MICPFCGKDYWMIEVLALHLVDQHLGEGAVDGGRLKRCDYSTGGVRCWCGEGPLGTLRGRYGVMSQWAKHLQDHGGPAAHLLALSMGISEGKP